MSAVRPPKKGHQPSSANRASKLMQWMHNAPTSKVSEKTPGRLYKVANKLLVISSNKTLNLKNSPPYLPSILVDTSQLIAAIFEKNSIELLRESTYVSIFIERFVNQCKKTLKLFKDAKEEMLDPSSPDRRELMKFSLVFSHMLTELKAFYPDGTLVDVLVIVKSEARAFWDKAFGKEIIVPWGHFAHEFSKVGCPTPRFFACDQSHWCVRCSVAGHFLPLHPLHYLAQCSF
eukprot:m.378728 g.378728  ORF g.378728 m.378728 type:complete len:232 (-) comp20937_c0_seq3:98-793(-)